MSNDEKAVQVLVQVIQQAIDNTLPSLPFDKTVTGTVTTVLSNNRYTVKIDGAEYTVPSATSDTYAVHDAVMVLYPQGSFQNKHIIGRFRGK